MGITVGWEVGHPQSYPKTNASRLYGNATGKAKTFPNAPAARYTHAWFGSLRPLGAGWRSLGQWPGLGVFLENGRIEIDNNLIENCRRRGIDPYAYLREVLTKLPTLTNRQIKDWTPEAYAKVLREKQRTELRRAS